MGYIKKLRIIGFKKFEDFEIEFNEKTNILVGENQSGKSTLIESLDLVINKIYESTDKYILNELFNKNNISKFLNKPLFENLPKIDIIVELDLDSSDRYSSEYYGLNWFQSDKKTSKYGIWFQSAIDKDLEGEVTSLINEKIIPFEYYSLSWRTFKNEPYNKMKKALRFVPIDASNNSTFNSIDFYSKRLFLKKYEEDLSRIKTNFRSELDSGFDRLKLADLELNKKFTLNHKKLLLENIIGIKDDNVLIENKGKGEEKLIKTRLSLDNKQDNDVIAIEEPENNLSHGNLRKLLSDIESFCINKQLIVTTHNNLIVTGLNLDNVIWISNSPKNNLKSLDTGKSFDKTSDYFKKLENSNLLRFILASKVILVEGPTELLLIPYFFKSNTNFTVEDDGIDVISCNGLSYKRYIEVAKTLNKKVAVITDNDGDISKIIEVKEFNSKNELIKVFTPDDSNQYTWEITLKDSDKTIEQLITLDSKAKYLVNGKELDDKYLAFMLTHKVDFALKMVESNNNFVIPQYLKDLFEWIRK
ncbi:MAG: ATP-dependent endonuclease [Bacilli bacterium]